MDMMQDEPRFTTEWIDADESILRIVFPRYYNTAALEDLLALITPLVHETAAQRLDFLVILNGSQIYGGSELLAHLHTMARQVPAAVQAIVYVRASTFTQMLLRNMGVVYPRLRALNHFVNSESEGLTLIRQLRENAASRC